MSVEKQCNSCNQSKPINEFEKTIKNEIVYFRQTCKKCKNSKDYQKIRLTDRYDRKKERNRQQRHDPKMRPRFILQDSKFADIKAGLENDIDAAFVSEMISQGCFYCESVADEQRKIGLDRIDNTKGHTKNNVNPCCSRCNFIRRSIPYAAWLLMVPAIKQANDSGLFDGWQYGFRHHQTTIDPRSPS